jgi:hypothetical protein
MQRRREMIACLVIVAALAVSGYVAYIVGSIIAWSRSIDE